MPKSNNKEFGPEHFEGLAADFESSDGQSRYVYETKPVPETEPVETE